MQYDFVICGQGLAGSLLAYQFIKSGYRVLVIDAGLNNTSSHIAAGMFTPISGKRMVKSWMVDELYPVMIETYKELEQVLGVSFLNEKNIQLSFASIKEQNDFFSALNDKTGHYVIEHITPSAGLQAPFGAVEITHSGWVNTSVFLHAFKQYLIERNAYWQHHFQHDELINQEESYLYQHLNFKCLIFCEGYQHINNPFFKHIEVIENKGDVFLLNIPQLDDEKIYKRGAYAVSIDNNQQLFKAGSTYKWNDKNDVPTPEGFEELKHKTDALIAGSYNIMQHFAGIRPTTKNRRPILAQHPQHQNMFVFNGLGTKGVLLAPYFSRAMFKLITQGVAPELK
jgi:glycine oxidase